MILKSPLMLIKKQTHFFEDRFWNDYFKEEHKVVQEIDKLSAQIIEKTNNERRENNNSKEPDN